MTGDSNVSSPVDDIELISDGEVRQAGEDVKAAAISARRMEIHQYYAKEITSEKRGFPVNHSAIHRLERERDQAKAEAETAFDHIPELFTVFNNPSPIYCQTIRGQLSDARASLTGAAVEKVDEVEILVADWTGNAAVGFNESFLNPFPAAVRNQIAVIEEMKAGVEAFEIILRQSRIDVRQVAQDTVTVLDSLYACNSENVSPVLGIISALAGAIAAPPTGGASLVLSLIGTGASIASSAASIEIGGSTVDDILQRMKDNLDQVRTGMVDNEDGLTAAFNESYATVSGVVNAGDAASQRDLVPNRPVVANGPPPRDDFDLPPEFK